jgi:hypothetical protein
MIEPHDDHDDWFDGPAGLVRAALILLAAAMLGLAYAAAVNTISPPANVGPQA